MENNNPTPTSPPESSPPFFSKVKNFFSMAPIKIRTLFYPLLPAQKAVGAVLSILILTAAVGTGAYLVQRVQNSRTQASGPILSLSTSNSNPRIGDTFVVAVAVNTNGAKISATDLEINFDNNLMDLTSSRLGTFLPVTLLPVRTGVGKFTLTLGCNPTSPVSGTGVLAQLTFRAKANGRTNITFGSTTAVAAIGQDTNAADTMNPVQITVGYYRSPTPSATPRPSATPTRTPYATRTPTPRPTATPTRTPYPTRTPTPRPSPTPTRSPTPVPSATPTRTPWWYH